MVECHLAKVKVAGSNPVSRSIFKLREGFEANPSATGKAKRQRGWPASEEEWNDGGEEIPSPAPFYKCQEIKMNTFFPLLKVEKIIEKKAGNIYLAKRERGKERTSKKKVSSLLEVLEKVKKEHFSRKNRELSLLKSLKIKIFDKLPFISEVDLANKQISFDEEFFNILKSINPDSLLLFYTLSLYHAILCFSGKNQNEALLETSNLFDKFSDEDKKIVKNALKNSLIDPGNIFLKFLEAEGKEKLRICSLLKVRALIDLSYDGEKIEEVSKRCGADLQLLRTQILQSMASTYEPKVDENNAKRVFEHCLESDKRLLVCRFGRAFYTDALLIADSRGIREKEIDGDIKSLEKGFKKVSLKIKDLEKLGPELQTIFNLKRENWFSLAQIEGAIDKLKEELRKIELEFLEKNDKFYSYFYEENYSKIQNFRKNIDAFRKIVYRFEQKILSSPKFEPAFVSFLSRIHELDAINIARVNDLLDPFFGENPKVEKLIRDCGHNTTITPNSVWLQYAQDWVEALPAFAHYFIIPKDKGYEVIALTEREVLEIIYKTSADWWAKNIEDVMMRENVDIARRLVAAKSNLKDENEEKIIAFIKKNKKEKEVASLTVFIEECAQKRAKEISSLQSKGSSRYEAILKLCKNLKLKESKTENNKRADFYLPYVLQKKRPIPTVHVLTTLGPTETQVNIANWLEEAISLYNIEREYHLEKEVVDKMSFYRKEIGKIALEIVEKEELQGEMLKVIADSGLSNCEDDMCKASLMLAGFHPEISALVNKISAEKLNLNSKNVLRDYVGPLARFNARRELVSRKGLAHLLNEEKYRYDSSGPCKRFNLVYAPSRVDLGPEIIESVRTVPKWVGGDGEDAARSGKSLYSLFNIAGVTAVNRPQIAEFLKVGENFFTRGGVYYLSLCAGTNINTLGVGDFEFFRSEWNKRGDRMVLPGGETYGGFCVPKEFSLLYAIITRALNPETKDEIFDGFGIPGNEQLREKITADLYTILKMRRSVPDEKEWEEKSVELLSSRYKEYFSVLGEKNAYLTRLPRLAVTLNKAGVLYEDEEVRNNYVITNWKNKKMLGSEEINRAGVFDKIRLIHLLYNEAKDKNHKVTGADELIGMIEASYKEDVTDVRFSAGARKFEIFCGTGIEHLLEDIDPEGREIYAKIFSQYSYPADIRMVGLCTAKDMFGHVPMDFSSYAREGYEILLKNGYDRKWIDENVEESGVDLGSWKWKIKDETVLAQLRNKVIFMAFGDNLAQISQAVKNRLLKFGLTGQTIKANAQTFGGNLKKWKGIEEKPSEMREKIIKSIGPAIHVLVLEERGIYSKERYPVAMTSCDFLDLGIPDKELLVLVDNLPKIIYLMKKDYNNSALIFADGTSGARTPTFAFRYPSCKDKVKELFAIEENAVYGCMGIGKETIEEWKREMIKEREMAQKLLVSVLEKRLLDASLILAEISRYIYQKEKIEELISLEIKARERGLDTNFYKIQREILGKINRGINLKELDFGAFLVIGGRYIFNGKISSDELLQIRENYEDILKQKSARLSSKVIDYVFKEKYTPQEEKFWEISTGVSGSLKAVEELHLKLETKEIRRKQYLEAIRLGKRRNSFSEEMKKQENNIQEIYRSAIPLSSFFFKEKDPEKCEEIFGKFLAKNKKAWQKLITNFSVSPEEITQEIETVFRGGEILESEYQGLAKRIGKFFELCKDDKAIENVAKVAELLDIALLMQETIKIEDEHSAWVAFARFFDLTINNHIFDYYPYHYSIERTSAFKNWSRDKIFKLATLHHRITYQYIRAIIEKKTEFKDKTTASKNLWFGKIQKGKIIEQAIGIKVEKEEEKFWFSYARFRDISTLIHDGYPIPEIVDSFDPELIKFRERVNIGIVYPLGNTTVSVALEQGPKLAKDNNINLFLVPFPEIEKGLLKAREAFFRDENNNWKLVRFSNLIVLHACWLHFTHPLRMEIEQLGLPLIQPFLWESATYLKCEYPAMLKGSGVALPKQENWYRKDTERFNEKAKVKIRKIIKDLARDCEVIIVKAEKESGGRRSKILPVRDGKIFYADKIEELVEISYDISKTDNVVIQEAIKSNVRELYTNKFLETLKERFIRELGIGIDVDAPLFSYFRVILMKRPSGEFIPTHYITVVSSAAIANVGQGGRLFEYRDEKINVKYREDLRREMERVSPSSIKAEEKYIKNNRRKIIESYLELHPEFAKGVSFEEKVNKIGVADWNILYEMGDYIPVFLVNRNDEVVKVYDEENEVFIPLSKNVRHGGSTSGMIKIKIYDDKGKVQNPPVKLFEGDKKRNLFWSYAREKKKKRKMRSLAVVKIEPNPGAGLWRPHNDRVKLAGRDGEGVYLVFSILGEWGKKYKDLTKSKKSI